MNKKALVLLLAAGGVLALAAGCSGDPDDAPAPAGQKPPTKSATADQEAERGNLRGGERGSSHN